MTPSAHGARLAGRRHGATAAFTRREAGGIVCPGMRFVARPALQGGDGDRVEVFGNALSYAESMCDPSEYVLRRAQTAPVDVLRGAGQHLLPEVSD